MKLLLTISVFLTCAFWVAGHDFKPTTEVGPCHGRPDGFAQDVNDCRRYFICENGHATRARCRGDLLFDSKNEACWWPEEVTCFRCPKTAVYSLLAVPRTCHQFYRCWQGRATIHTCPNDLVFDRKRGQCSFLRGSGCEGDETLEETCPERDGENPVYMRDAASCSRFHICQNGRPWPQECADGLHFNPVLRICDTPERAGCVIDQNPNDPESEWTPEVGPEFPEVVCPESGNGFVPHPDNCNAYFACTQHQAVPLNCAPGLHFDHQRQVCDRAANSRCWSREQQRW